MAREMKDSGIEWIGEICNDYKVVRLKFLLKEPLLYGANESGIQFDEKLPRYIRITDIDSNGALKATGKLSLSMESANGFILKDGDVLFARSGASVGKTFLYYEKYGLSAFAGYLIRARLNELVKAKYFYYYTQSSAYESWKNQFFIQSTIQNIGADRYCQLPVVISNLASQEQIVRFLDTQCAHIDSVIEKTRVAIEEYKKLKQAVITQAVTKGIRPNREMKDSGIEWIGEIPKEWEINSVSQLFSQVKNKNTDLQETNLLSLSYGKIIRKNIETTDGLLPESFDGYNIIEAKDIVLRLTDLQNDHKSLRVGLVTERGIITSAYLTIRNHSTSLAKYIYYYLYAFDISKGFYGMGAGVRQGLNWDGVKWLKILSPSVAEQQIIVDFLDNKCKHIGALIQKKKQLITELEAYKKSLIYEYVTGKKEVPDNKTISISVEFQIALLMCKILKTTGIKGRTHLQKVTYASDTLLDLFPETQYYRYPHGPYDLNIERYESIMESQGWVTVDKSKGYVRYKKTKRFIEFESQYQDVFKNRDKEIRKICNLFNVKRTSKAEKMATVLASWNDFLIDGVNPTDDMIINDIVTNWTANKANISVETWRVIIQQLKENQMIPKGYGKHTLKKEQNDYAH